MEEALKMPTYQQQSAILTHGSPTTTRWFSFQSLVTAIGIIWLTLLTFQVYIPENNERNGTMRWIAPSRSRKQGKQPWNHGEMVALEGTTDHRRRSGSDIVMIQGKNLTWRFPPNMPYLDALKTCETLKCVRDAHLQPRTKGEKFNFPHFIIAGYSKSATTSMYKYLIHHPEVVVPKVKEADLFTNRCSFEGKRMDCPDEKVREYIQDILHSGRFVRDEAQRAVFEATPRIMDLGPVLAEGLYELMPWVKLISSMREPISRTISKYVMLFDKGINSSCIHDHSLVHCLRNDDTPIMGNPKQSYYSHPLKAWLDNFPKEQLHLIQYEDLVNTEENGEIQAREIRRLKEFIGVSMDGLPDALNFEDANCRHCRIKPQGWPMKETFYRKLIEKVKPDVLELVRLIDKHNLGNGTRWYQNWERVWDTNLESCDKVTGMCHIQLT